MYLEEISKGCPTLARCTTFGAWTPNKIWCVQTFDWFCAIKLHNMMLIQLFI